MDIAIAPSKGPQQGDASDRDDVPARTRRSTAVHLTVAERVENGKAVREVVGRGEHGEWAPAPVGRDPVDLLEEQALSRVPELVPLRYGRMLGRRSPSSGGRRT